MPWVALPARANAAPTTWVQAQSLSPPLQRVNVTFGERSCSYSNSIMSQMVSRCGVTLDSNCLYDAPPLFNSLSDALSQGVSSLGADGFVFTFLSFARNLAGSDANFVVQLPPTCPPSPWEHVQWFTFPLKPHRTLPRCCHYTALSLSQSQHTREWLGDILRNGSTVSHCAAVMQIRG